MDCGQDMVIIDGKTESALQSTEVFVIQKHGCANPNCTNYMGKNRENTEFVKESRIKIN